MKTKNFFSFVAFMWNYHGWQKTWNLEKTWNLRNFEQKSLKNLNFEKYITKKPEISNNFYIEVVKF